MKPKKLIPWAKPDYWGNEKKYVTQALKSTWISGGPFVERLERDFSQYVDSPYVLAVSNGTTALHLAYLGLGIGPGDEVILPGFAFMGAANIILHLGAKPVFAEVDPLTWCLTAEAVEKCLTQHTKTIIPIHTYGNVCNMDPILAMARSKGISIIEDAAEAFASQYNHRMAGTLAEIGTFSFQATKTITTGEGGMVVTTKQDIYEKMALYRSHGMKRQTFYWHELAGHNFRLTNIQAALGCAQLEKIEVILRERKHVYSLYQKLLMGIPGVTPQFFETNVTPVVWAIAVKLDLKAYPQGRDLVMEHFRERNIETRPGFYAPSFMKDLYDCPSLPICEEISRSVISFPCYPSLSDELIDYICTTLRNLRK